MVYFKESEFTDFQKMQKDFLEQLDNLRMHYGKPFRLNCDYRDGEGYHGLGRAVDFVIRDGLKLSGQLKNLAMILDAIGLPYRIGAYPFWNTPGWHFDNCDCKKEKTTYGATPAKYWVRNKAGVYMYCSDFETMLKLVESFEE